MNYLKTLTLLSMISLFTACVFESRNGEQDKSSDINNIEWTSDDIIGKWNQIDTESSLKETTLKIESIQFNENDSAEIQITDSLGSRKINGQWKYGFDKQIGDSALNVKIESDIQVNFNLTKNHAYKLLLKLTEENNKLVMTGHKSRFEKL